MLAPNTLLNNRYRIEEPIGRGGMGAVYKARDERLHATVAVKEATVIDRQLLMAFEKEARRLAPLRHNGLPRVWDHFVEGFGHYLVMDYIEGEDLAEKLAANNKQPFSVVQVLACGDQLLAILEYLHGQQPPIIHRDIKPSNLKLMSDGTLILLDFGLAKGGLTQSPYASRSLFGYSTGYSPPEQMRNQGTDERSDLYAVAATLWTLLTAQPAIDALVREQAATTGVRDPMRPANELNPQVPSLLAQTLRRALALDLNQRPSSATIMRQLLRAQAERLLREQKQTRRRTRSAKQQHQVVERPITHDHPIPPFQKASDHPTITPSIKPLSPWNPRDHLRLLWWTLVMPQQLKAYRKQFGEKAERPTGKWLVSTLICLPIFLPFSAVGLELISIVLSPESKSKLTTTPYLWASGGVFIVWLLTGMFGDSNDGEVWTVGALIGLIGLSMMQIVPGGLVVVLVGVVGLVLAAALAKSVAGVSAQALALGQAVGFALGLMGLFVDVPTGLEIKLEGLYLALWLDSVIRGLTLIIKVFLFSFLTIITIILTIGPALGLMVIIEAFIEAGQSSWMARGAFGLLVVVYAFLVWYSYLGGWQQF